MLMVGDHKDILRAACFSHLFSCNLLCYSLFPMWLMYSDGAMVALHSGWASRAYFSDNGSTAIEIALKMAFRKFSFDHGILSDFCKDNMAGRGVELMVGLASFSF